MLGIQPVVVVTPHTTLSWGVRTNYLAYQILDFSITPSRTMEGFEESQKAYD